MSVPGQCGTCKNYDPDTGSCPAFYPREIPKDVMTGEVSHRKPIPGDGGVRYEPLEGWE